MCPISLFTPVTWPPCQATVLDIGRAPLHLAQLHEMKTRTSLQKHKTIFLQNCKIQ